MTTMATDVRMTKTGFIVVTSTGTDTEEGRRMADRLRAEGHRAVSHVVSVKVAAR